MYAQRLVRQALVKVRKETRGMVDSYRTLTQMTTLPESHDETLVNNLEIVHDRGNFISVYFAESVKLGNLQGDN